MAISHSGLKTGDSAAAADAAKSGLLSRSKCLRERGNTLYREATSQTSLPSIRGARLQDAIQLYCQALSLSQSDNDRAMCCKNLGQAFWARAKLNLALAEQKSPQHNRSSDKFVDSLCFDLLSSVTYFLEALGFSRPATQPKEWVQGIQWTLVDIAWTVDDMRDSFFRSKGRFLWELCAVFQQKIPRNNVKLQASAIVHKACARDGLRSAMNGEGSGLEKLALLEEALLQLSVAEAHTDSSATAFLLEIGALRDAILKRIEQQHRDLASPRVNQNQKESRNQNARVPEAHRSPQPQLRRNQTYSEERSHAAQSRMSADSRPPGLAGKGGSFRVPPGGRSTWSGSQPSDLERMFTTLCPSEFLQRLYEKYPPPGGRKESMELGARDIRDLKSAYKKAISLYHPDHDHGFKQHGKLADEITKYLIINFNNLKGE